MNDTLVFAPEDELEDTSLNSAECSENLWKVLVVDDDADVHRITTMALENFSFEGSKLDLIHAYSGTETKEIMEDHDDIALILLDVVMETDHAGLEVAKYIREDLENTKTRIVLRTGQPGQAPEEEIIKNYDINDYKEKTELTSRKLYTLLYSCLRAYRDILALEHTTKGLEKVINSSKNIFERQYIDEFASGVLQQISSIMYAQDGAILNDIASAAAHEEDGFIKVVAGTGDLQTLVGENISEALPSHFRGVMKNLGEGCFYSEGDFLAASRGNDGQLKAIYLKGIHIKDNLQKHLLELFTQNVLVAFENLSLREEIMDTQREVVYRLGEAVETRSKETGNHVKRVAEMSRLLALKLGMSQRDAEILKHASPLHDLGKIGIPDAVLNKPGKLDEIEWATMQTHTTIGYNMLNDTEREILKVGATISKEHHEKWDGSGYPEGLQGQNISIEARITAVADVYDALASDRCYKKSWPLEKVYELFNQERGKHFDPEIVDLLFENIDGINRIRSRYQDTYNA
ncbi:DUF3369 domain-containing protein [Curvivirga sp.]|uniref:DUF3369 domain-containing protein n=1 Tax=Curvivirga sp. TaxID=2856848 RepID=UPI003B5A67D7